jgi:hypothetical protein
MASRALVSLSSSACYVCATNTASDRPDVVAACASCGVLFCLLDGARHHKRGEALCAICLVPRLLEEGGIPPGGGGPEPDEPPDPTDPTTGITSDRKSVREKLGDERYERLCGAMWEPSSGRRLGWRRYLGELEAENAADIVARRIGDFVHGRAWLKRAYTRSKTADLDGVAAAIAIAEHAARSQVSQEGLADQHVRALRVPANAPAKSRIEEIAERAYQEQREQKGMA